MDNCTGQNKNYSHYTASIDKVYSAKIQADTIMRKYLQAGHTFMSAGSFHAIIQDYWPRWIGYLFISASTETWWWGRRHVLLSLKRKTYTRWRVLCPTSYSMRSLRSGVALLEPLLAKGHVVYMETITLHLIWWPSYWLLVLVWMGRRGPTENPFC